VRGLRLWFPVDYRWGLAVGGGAGVRHMQELLGTELAPDVMLCGLAFPEAMNRSRLASAGASNG
jgi:hypothetical protein